MGENKSRKLDGRLRDGLLVLGCMGLALGLLFWLIAFADQRRSDIPVTVGEYLAQLACALGMGLFSGVGASVFLYVLCSAPALLFGRDPFDAFPRLAERRRQGWSHVPARQLLTIGLCALSIVLGFAILVISENTGRKPPWEWQLKESHSAEAR